MYELVKAGAGSAAIEADLRRIVDSGKALFSADLVLLENGERRDIMPGIPSFRAWTTKAQPPDESWTAYCLRTFQEGSAGLDVLREFESQIRNLPKKDSSGIFLQINFGEKTDPLFLVPQDKMDVQRAEAAVAAGYPTVEPILMELLEWIQDYNWPVAHVLNPFLATVGMPLEHHLRKILRGDDNGWKYYVLEIVENSCELTTALQDQLERIATSPTNGEKEEELDQLAREVLEKYGLASSSTEIL